MYRSGLVKVGYFHISLLIFCNQCPTIGKMHNSNQNYLIILIKKSTRKEFLFTYHFISMQNCRTYLIDIESQKNS